MHILFLSDNFPPEVNAPASRTFEHCREWVKAGHRVTVITCAPNFPEGKVFPGYRNALWQRDDRDGIEVIRVWSYITGNEGFLGRIFDYVSFAMTSFCAGLFRRFDVIVATSPQFFTTLSAFALSKIRRRPWVFELRDLWPDTIAAVGAIRSGRVLRALERLELFLYRDATRIVAVTEAFKSNLIARGIDESKIDVVTNGVELDEFQPMPRDADLENALGLRDKTVVGYFGTHGMCQGLDFVVDCLADADPRLHFLFVGSGAEKPDVVRRAGELRLTNVTFLDPVPRADMRRYLSLADFVLVPLKNEDVFKTVIPSKIFESAAMQKPILLGVDGQARQIVEHHGAGVFYQPEDRSDFLVRLGEMAQDKDRAHDLQAGCASLALAYDRRRLAHSMIGHLEKALR